MKDRKDDDGCQRKDLTKVVPYQSYERNQSKTIATGQKKILAKDLDLQYHATEVSKKKVWLREYLNDELELYWSILEKHGFIYLTINDKFT